MKDSSSKIALGTVQFGLKYGIGNIKGRTNSVEVSKILDSAYSHGVRVVDTAQAYGESEKVLGCVAEKKCEKLIFRPVCRFFVCGNRHFPLSPHKNSQRLKILNLGKHKKIRLDMKMCNEIKIWKK